MNRRAVVMRWILYVAAAVALTVVAARSAAPARAAFPGANGRIAFTLTMMGNSDIWTMDEGGGDWIRLTTHPGFDSDPVWSPDGNRLAFVSNRDGNSEIYVMNADGSGLTNVSNSPDNESAPSWSHSGKQIAFHGDQNGALDIYVVDLDSKFVSLKASNGAWPAWSPLGDKIAFGGTGPDGFSDIMVLTLSTNKIDNLTITQGGEIHQNLPNWSPDGSHIVYIGRSASGRNQLYTMPAVVGGASTPLAHATTGIDLWPAYSADGQWVSFISSREHFGRTDFELWKAHVSGNFVIRLTFGFGSYGSYLLSDWQPRPGNSITVQANTTETKVSPRDWTLQGSGPIGNFTIAAGGGTRTFTNLPPGEYTITQTPMPGYFPPEPCVVTLAAGEAQFCQFFNDYDDDPTRLVGQLAFSSTVEGGENAIYTVYSDGAGLRRLTSGRYNYTPTWSPSGDQIVYDSSDSWGITALWGVNVSTLTASSRLAPTDGANVSEPSWSPANPNELAFSADFGGVDSLYMVNPQDGTGLRPIADAQGMSFSPAISPDGTRVAYTRFVNGQYDIYLAPSGNSGVSVNLTQDAAVDGGPAWSPDGRWLVYASVPSLFGPDRWDLWLIDRNGVKQRLTNTPLVGEFYPAWSPDGTTIAFTQSDNSGGADIYVMNADGTGAPAQVTNYPGGEYFAEWKPSLVGALTIKVAVNGPTPTADWQFDGGLGTFSLPAGGGRRTFHNRVPGDFTITQTAQAGYTAAFSCDNGATGAAAVTVALLRGHHVTCTVTNTAQGTGLTIVKNVVGAAPDGAWQFSLSGQPNFTLPGVGGSKSFSLSAGTYTVAETARAGYAAAVRCMPGGESGSNAVTVALAPGQQKTCTFTNTNQMGTIRVKQEVKPAGTNGPGPWPFTGALGEFTLPKEGGEETFNVPAGSYDITQVKVDGFNQTVLCNNGEKGQRKVTIALAPNQTIRCTFTATKVNPMPGATVYAADANGDSDIYLLDTLARDGQPIQLTFAGGDDYDPALSADGTQIVFTSERDGNPELYVMDFDGGNVTRLTQTAARERHPAWSPDGTEVAYESDQDGNDDIFVLGLFTGSMVRITNSPAAQRSPTWVPSAGAQRRLVYVGEQDGNPELYDQLLDGPVLPPARRMTNNTTVDYAPRGAQRAGTPVVAFSCQSTGGIMNMLICLASLHGDGRAATAEPTVLVDAPGINYPLGWSADGEELYFSSTRDGDADLYRIDADGANETQLTNDPASEGEADPRPLPLGDITVRAVVVGPAPAADWQFAGDLGTFTLPAAGGSRTFSAQTAGGYWLTETPTPGYSRTVQCANGATGAGSVILTLDPGQHVICTFTHVADVGAVYRLYTPVVRR